MKVWRAMPDVLGRRLSVAKPAKEGGYVPLLNTKHEPDMDKSGPRYRGQKSYGKNTFDRVLGVSATPGR